MTLLLQGWGMSVSANSVQFLLLSLVFQEDRNAKYDAPAHCGTTAVTHRPDVTAVSFKFRGRKKLRSCVNAERGRWHAETIRMSCSGSDLVIHQVDDRDFGFLKE